MGRHPSYLPLALAVVVQAQPAPADDFITTSGRLGDDDFYRLVACAAPPGEPCGKPFLHWTTDRPLLVQLTSIDDAFLGGRKKRAEAALVRALQYLNDVGMGLELRQVPPGDKADIRIHFLDTDGSAPLADTGIDGADGATVTGARVIVWSERATGAIRKATILFGTRLHISQYESAMLEEVTQALGLLTDIRNPLYEGVSIFSQDSNATKQFSEQDRMALRRHYPPAPARLGQTGE